MFGAVSATPAAAMTLPREPIEPTPEPVYRTAGAWGAGEGCPLSWAQMDANLHKLWCGIRRLEER